MKKNLPVLICIAILAMPVKAQNENKLKVNLTGRILLDGAAYAGHDEDLFKAGLALPDIRMGAKASFGKWGAKIDVGYAYGKIGMKDVYLQYNFNDDNFLRGGNFIHMYGPQTSTSSSMKPGAEAPTSDDAFNISRQIGFMYEHSADKYLGTASFGVEPAALTNRANATGGQGYTIQSRQLFRPIHEDGKYFQIGVSGGFCTPTYNSANPEHHYHDSFTMSANFPTRVSQVQAVGATIGDAMNQWKFTPEIMAAYGPVALEAQYFYNRVNRRHDFHSFTGQGAYATLRTLCIGGQYGYDRAGGVLATPKPGSLECVLQYNYTTLSDASAKIYGGRFNDITCTFNYYINKYMVARLHYGYSHRWDSATLPRVDVSTFQARLQIIF